MNKCINRYIIKKVLVGIKDLVLLLALTSLIIGIPVAIVQGMVALSNWNKYVGAYIVVGALWIAISESIKAARDGIMGLVHEAKESCE